MNIAIVGAGTVGTAVAIRWRDAGHAIVGVTGRDATRERAARWLPGVPVDDVAAVVREAEVVAIAVPDRAIAAAATDVAGAIRPGAAVLHLSGSLGLAALQPVATAGGVRLALHPLQTFADVEGAVRALDGTSIAVTAAEDDGWRLGDELAVDLGGRPFHLPDGDRALYHAAAVFASNYLVAVSGAAATLFGAAQVPDPMQAMRPLQEATLTNVHRLGPRDALTGPAVRGDADTIARNLEAIGAAAPSLVEPYVALCRAAMDVASDRLGSEDRQRVEEVLARWS
jgi:predicted short-subunit dehydrogenase-like oxidoreductase (DUF2520 family)